MRRRSGSFGINADLPLGDGVSSSVRTTSRGSWIVWPVMLAVGTSVAWFCLDAYREGHARIEREQLAGQRVEFSRVRSNRNALALFVIASVASASGLLGTAVVIMSFLSRTRTHDAE